MSDADQPHRTFDHDAYCTTIGEQTEGLASILERAGPDTPVPTCPGWDLLALIKHVGVIQRWAAQMIRDGSVDRVDPRAVDRALPETPDGFAPWARSSAQLLIEQLRGRGPETEVWTWGPGRTVGWWARRMAFESLIHRADAALAVGEIPGIDGSWAVDGIDELLENLPAAAAFAPTVAELRGDGETLHLHATDAPGEWMITMTPQGYSWRHGHSKGDVAVRGAATDLLLLVYGRLDADDARFARFGDAAVLARWLHHSAI